MRHRQALSGGDGDLLLDDIDAGDLLGDGVLDLQAGVHLEEEKLAARVLQKLDGAGVLIAGGAGDFDGAFANDLALDFAQLRRGGDFDEFLVAALDRAIAVEKMDDVAFRIAEYLDFDMARIDESFFDENRAGAKRFFGFGNGARELAADFAGVVALPDAAPAAARRGFEHHRIADFAGDGERFVDIGDGAVAAGERAHAGVAGERAGGEFVAQAGDGLRIGADEADAAAFAAGGEFGIFGQKSVARVDGVAIEDARVIDDFAGVEVAGKRVRADAMCFVGFFDMQGVAVGVGIDGDGANAHFGASAHKADGDFAAVGDKQALNHFAIVSQGRRQGGGISIIREHPKKGGKTMTEKWESIFEKAVLRLQKGDIDGAIRLCDEVINLPEKAIPSKNRASAFGMRGNAYQEKGDLDRAISDFDEAIKLDPKDALVFGMRGDAYKNKGDLDRAITNYDEVIKLDPKDALAFSMRGDIYKDKGDLDRAIANYDEAIKLDPKIAAISNNRGNAYEAKGNLDRAITNYDEAIKLDPKYTVAFFNRGNIYKKKGDFDRAISDLNEAIKLDPTDATVFNNRGNAYEAKGDLDRAISDFGEAIKLDPKNAAAFNNRGVAYKEKDEIDRAISDYDEAIKLDPKNAAAFNNRGNAYKEKGEIDRAISDYDEAIKLDPNHTKAFHNRALVYGRLNAQADEKKYREGYEQEMQKLREELRKVSDPGEVIETYKKRENEYKDQIKALGDEIKTFADELHNRLAEGFVGIAFFIVAILIFGDNPLGLAHGFTLTSLMLAWLAVNYPASIRLSDMRKEKRKMEICAEDYFRKLTLARYALASEGDERQKMMAVTHAHFATRSAAEFLADWNPANDDKSNPLFDSIEKILRRKDDDSPPKPPETKPSA